jgi:hypothetical protein
VGQALHLLSSELEQTIEQAQDLDALVKGKGVVSLKHLNFKSECMIHRVQSAGCLDIDFTVGNFLRKCCTTCQEKCFNAAGTASIRCLLLSLIINHI